MLRYLLLSVAVIAAGCVTINPTSDARPQEPAATPISARDVVPPVQPAVVEPPPKATAAVTPSPTPTPTIRPTPTPEVGTSWMEYLNFSLEGAENMLAIIDDVGSGEIGRMLRGADDGIAEANRQIAWLNSHPPQRCWEFLSRQHGEMMQTFLDAFHAVENLDLESIELMQDATDQLTQLNSMFDSTDCLAGSGSAS